ncbi:hypothetical protein [Candidatus Nitrososphaera sp. FF02]|uniref:hypothetical protein n=1 Tax=Candidatus Nitrososphaera sp. FF02 TaxID=3398226 RepID=UPI0039E9730A
MAQTTFRAEIDRGAGFDDAVTVSMIADDTSIGLFGPVILADATVTDLPHAASTTSAGSLLAIGVCVSLPRSGTLTADKSIVEVCVYGRCKIKVGTADVALNDPLETSGTAGEAQVQPSTEISTTYDKADEVEAFNNIRASFAIALTTVSSGADSIVCGFVNIVPGVRVTAE